MNQRSLLRQVSIKLINRLILMESVLGFSGLISLNPYRNFLRESDNSLLLVLLHFYQDINKAEKESGRERHTFLWFLSAASGTSWIDLLTSHCAGNYNFLRGDLSVSIIIGTRGTFVCIWTLWCSL